MTVQALNSGVAASIAAATSQESQLAIITALFPGNLSVRYYSAAGVLLDTVVYAGWVLSATTPRHISPGAFVSRTLGTPGTASYAIAAIPGGADVLRVDVALSGAVAASYRTNLGAGSGANGIRVVASSGLPVVAMPAWLSGVAVNQVVSIPGTAFSLADEDVINAWGCLVLIDGTGKLVCSAGGGHGDSSDNGVYSIDLLTDSPGWSTQIAASAVGDIINDASYYADGKPGSRHGYQHAHYISQRGRIMLFGQRGRFPSGGDGFALDAHSVSGSWAWDARNTYPDVGGANAYGVAHDPITGNVITYQGQIWSQAANAWAAGSAFPGFSWRWPIVYWPDEDNFFALQWGNGENGGSGVTAQRVNKTTAATSAVTFNSSAALTQFQADAPAYAGMGWDEPNGRFLFFEGRPSGTQRIYAITPNVGGVWDMSILATTGAVMAAGPIGGARINGRFRYVPALGGFAVMPTAASGMYFLRTL